MQHQFVSQVESLFVFLDSRDNQIWGTVHLMSLINEFVPLELDGRFSLREPVRFPCGPPPKRASKRVQIGICCDFLQRLSSFYSRSSQVHILQGNGPGAPSLRHSHFRTFDA